MRNKKCFIMGLPEAGKTTFLAALWYVLKNSNTNKLKLKEYSGDLSYISSISRKWVNTEEIERTKPTYEQKSISLTLEDENKDVIVFSFPDLSGETFQNQYEKREADNEIVTYLKESNGILLFINPNTIKEPFLISEVPLGARASVGDGEVEFSTRNPKESDPTQVILVELLQFAMQMRYQAPVNLCIIISAWDLVEKYNNPKDFVLYKLPLLWQFVESNNKVLNTSFYGASAQGDSLDNREELLKNENPCNRVFVVDASGNKFNDITIPLSMVVSGESEIDE